MTQTKVYKTLFIQCIAIYVSKTNPLKHRTFDFNMKLLLVSSLILIFDFDFEVMSLFSKDLHLQNHVSDKVY